ncbi:calcium/sodium antiporter [Candidatus Woesearchaeota archaeon]|nr:calcium/sodium antiporter [Candidatus Woesearchaeota archaeon]
MLIVNILLFIIGLVLLVKGADYFVKAAATIARVLGVSEFVIGLTLVSLGTSIPELASSIQAVMRGATGLVIGNVVGSNIANICLVIGVSASIMTIKTKKEMLNRDGYIMLFVTVLFYLFLLNSVIGLVESIILLLLYIAYLFYLFDSREGYGNHFPGFLKYFFTFGYVTLLFRKQPKKKKVRRESLWKDILILVGGSAAVIYGSHFVVEGALYFAEFFSVSDSFIGVTVVALGTSLPELVVTISALRKGYGTIALGNVLGSNVTNILLIIGVTGMISNLQAIQTTLLFTAPFMILMSILMVIFMRTDWRIRRREGVGFTLLYIIFLIAIFALRTIF